MTRTRQNNPRPINMGIYAARRVLAGAVTQERRLNSALMRDARVGDLLWLREPYRFLCGHEANSPTTIAGLGIQPPPLWFEADGNGPKHYGKLRPARVLLRSLSRAVLKVTAIRIAPLQEWSSSDRASLGLDQDIYAEIWNKNRQSALSFGKGQTGYWRENPLVSIIDFALIKSNIDEILLKNEVRAPNNVGAASPEPAPVSDTGLARSGRSIAPEKPTPHKMATEN